jgi:hypothetical protein
VREERNLFCGAPQSAFEFGVEFAADRGHLVVAELPKECGGLVDSKVAVLVAFIIRRIS